MAEFTINSRKYDGKIHRSWKANLLEETTDYWLFRGEFETMVRHSKLGIIRRGTVSYEYYLKTKWFNIFRFHEPEGNFKYYYCNLNMPPIFQNQILDYVDLDIDVLVKKDFNYEILDLEEFDTNSKQLKYSDEVIYQTQTSLDDLLEIIGQKRFPFDYKSL